MDSLLPFQTICRNKHSKLAKYVKFKHHQMGRGTQRPAGAETGGGVGERDQVDAVAGEGEGAEGTPEGTAGVDDGYRESKKI